MPSAEEELFLADTQQASHQRIKCLEEEEIFRLHYDKALPSLHNNSFF